LIHTYHAVPLPCNEYAFLKAILKAMAGSQQGDGMSQHGDLPAFSLLLLPCPVPGRLLLEAYQYQTQVASVKQSNVGHGREEAYYFDART
jgi:hypothetical protein